MAQGKVQYSACSKGTSNTSSGSSGGSTAVRATPVMQPPWMGVEDETATEHANGHKEQRSVTHWPAAPSTCVEPDHKELIYSVSTVLARRIRDSEQAECKVCAQLLHACVVRRGRRVGRQRLNGRAHHAWAEGREGKFCHWAAVWNLLSVCMVTGVCSVSASSCCYGCGFCVVLRVLRECAAEGATAAFCGIDCGHRLKRGHFRLNWATREGAGIQRCGCAERAEGEGKRGR
eukprot:6174279-Pleurochrysis_carterae.AAC.2